MTSKVYALYMIHVVRMDFLLDAMPVDKDKIVVFVAVQMLAA